LICGTTEQGDGLVEVADFDLEQPRQPNLARNEPDDRLGGD
jgi:hypothetical protein